MSSATIIPFPVPQRPASEWKIETSNEWPDSPDRRALQAAIAERYQGRAPAAQMSQSQMDRTAGMAIAFLHGPSKTDLDECIKAWAADLDRRGL